MPIFENVVPALAQALSQRGYETLTPVQSAVLAPHLQTADLIVSAQTGSGKTVAFGLTLAAALLGGRARFDRAGAPLALVIAPTRELALQVKRELDWLLDPAGASVVSCVGGMDARDERRALHQGAHVVVGTPGRLVDHIRRGALVMDDLRAVVLDEADEMMNLGFREELEHILDAAPPTRRTLLFSATIPRAIEALAKKYQRDAVRVNTASDQKQHVDIEYRALVAASHESENAIFNVLRYYDATNALVFCATRAAVTRLTSRFEDRGVSVVALSGELSQSQRTHALQALRDHRAQVCVATDVAARGIDLPDLDLVIHADLPKNTETLLHRSGRTGRAGRKGTSVLIVPFPARKRTERLLWDAKIEAEWGVPPSADDVKQRDDERLLNDGLLGESPRESEERLVQTLLARHSVQNIAAAFVRLYRKGQAAPEDLAPAPEVSRATMHAERTRRGEPRPAQRDNFQNGVWVSLSIGRAQSAEPRWLIPMLCKAGAITKADIGAIRIQQQETLVEIDPASVDGFFDAVGRQGKLEKSIVVTRIGAESNGQRTRPDKPPRKPFNGPHANRPQFSAKAARVGEQAGRPKSAPAYKAKTARAPRAPSHNSPPAGKKRKWTPDD